LTEKNSFLETWAIFWATRALPGSGYGPVHLHPNPVLKEMWLQTVIVASQFLMAMKLAAFAYPVLNFGF
jgi:hypothetical protein